MMFTRAKPKAERGEKDALARFNAYLLISKGDPDKALELVQAFAPKDLRNHAAVIRRAAKEAK